MTDDIMVSVYCLTYNHEEYIRDALDGFVKQKTNFKYEVIVHDDASTDGTADIIKEYSEKYPDIIKPILQTENQYSKGVNIVRRFIKPLMRGKYIAMCEGDDYWIDEKKLQKQVEFLEKNKEYISCTCNVDRLNVADNSVEKLCKSTTDHDMDLYEVLRTWGRGIHLSALMYRREIADIIYSDDRPEMFKIKTAIGDYKIGVYLALSGKIRYISDTVSLYRHGTKNSWTDKHRSDESLIGMYDDMISILEAANKGAGVRERLIFKEMTARYKYQIYTIHNKRICALFMKFNKYARCLINILLRRIYHE